MTKRDCCCERNVLTKNERDRRECLSSGSVDTVVRDGRRQCDTWWRGRIKLVELQHRMVEDPFRVGPIGDD